jgi:hypothetical protein
MYMPPPSATKRPPVSLLRIALEAAKNAGIAEAAITKAAGGNLSDFFLSELESAAHAEAARLAEKDKR